MIYDFHLGKLILTPPKTASSTLHTELCSRAGCFYILAMAQWGRISKHCALGELGQTPYEFAFERTYDVLLTVRHPIERLISMYGHQCRYDGYSGCFEDWVRDRESDGGKNWLRSCHSHLSGQQPDGILRTEFLNKDLEDHELPTVRLRVNESKESRQVDRDLAADTARRWWPDDWQYYQ